MIPKQLDFPAVRQMKSEVDRILQGVRVYGICVDTHGLAEVKQLAEMGVGFLIRGISTEVWGTTPEMARERLAARKDLIRQLAENGIVTSILITHESILPGRLGRKKYEEFVCRHPSGSECYGESPTFGQGCLNDREFVEHLKAINRAVVDSGIRALHHDVPSSRFWARDPLPGFCDDCCRQFNKWLKNEVGVAHLREEYGIENLDTFHYRRYLEENGWVDKPEESPLHDLWWIFELESDIQAERAIVSDVKEYAWTRYGKSVVCQANQWGIERASPFEPAESEIYDFVAVGRNWRMDWREGDKRNSAPSVPPQFSLLPMYRMAQAQTPDKEIVMWFDIYHTRRVPDWYTALPVDQQDRFMKWHMAEAYAARCFFAVHFRHMQFEGPPFHMMAPYCKYFNQHFNLYRNTKHAAKVAVLHSYPSRIWERFYRKHSLAYYGVCQALLDANLQFEAVFLGDGRICPNRLTDHDLSQFRAVVAPRCFSMTDEGMNLLQRYVEGGGNLVIADEFASCDQMHRKREVWTVEPRGEGDIAYLDEDFEAYLGKRDETPRNRLLELLSKKTGITPEISVEGSDQPPLVVLRRSADAERLFVDVVNRAFKLDQGFNSQKNLAIKVLMPLRGDVTEIKLLSPDRGNSKPVSAKRSRSEREITFELPELDVYSLASIRLAC